MNSITHVHGNVYHSNDRNKAIVHEVVTKVSAKRSQHKMQDKMSTTLLSCKKRKIHNTVVDLVPTTAQVDLFLAKNKSLKKKTSNYKDIENEIVEISDTHKYSQSALDAKKRRLQISSIPKVSLHISTTDTFPLLNLQQHRRNSTRQELPRTAAYYNSLIQETLHFYDDFVPKELVFKSSNNVAVSETLSNSSSSDCQPSSRSVHDLRTNEDDEMSPSASPAPNEAPSFPILGPSSDRVVERLVGKRAFSLLLPRSILHLLQRNNSESMFEPIRYSFEKALSLSPCARLVVEAEHPFRIVHANAELYRLGVDGNTKLNGRPLLEAESLLETVADTLVTKHTFADTNKVVLSDACAKLFVVGCSNEDDGYDYDHDASPTHYLIQLETQNSLRRTDGTMLEQPPLMAVG